MSGYVCNPMNCDSLGHMSARIAELEQEEEEFREATNQWVNRGIEREQYNAALRSLVESLEEVKAEQKARIATLEAQVEQAREALEDILRCDRSPMRCAECPAARSYCGTLVAGHALQALREGGEG